MDTALTQKFSFILDKNLAKAMEVEYSGGGALIFSYHILIHKPEHFGGLYDNLA